MQLKIEYIPLRDIKPYAGNAKLHPAEQIEQIKNSITQFGFNDPIAIWNGEIVEGHGRYIAATEMNLEEVPVIRLDGLSDEERRAYALVHNKLTLNSDFDIDLLQLELDAILDIDMADFGFDIGDDEDTEMDVSGEKGNLAKRFLVPPFSVIYGNKKDWLDRKRAWLAKGIKSELGRGGGLVFQLPKWMDRQAPISKGVR